MKKADEEKLADELWWDLSTMEYAPSIEAILAYGRKVAAAERDEDVAYHDLMAASNFRHNRPAAVDAHQVAAEVSRMRAKDLRSGKV